MASIYLQMCMSSFNQTMLAAGIKSNLMAQACKTFGVGLKGLRDQTPAPQKMFVFGATTTWVRNIAGQVVDWGDKNTFNLRGKAEDFYKVVKTCITLYAGMKCAEFLLNRWGFSVQINRYIVMLQVADILLTKDLT